MRITCFIITFCLITFTSTAQRHFLNGFLKDSTYGLGIGGARISNTTNNDIVFSNKKGFFRVQVADGDKLILSFKGYNPHFLSYLSSPNNDTIIVYLVPLGKTLPTVTVSKGYNQYQLDSLNRKIDFEQFRGGRLSDVSRADGFGITLNLDRFTKQRYKGQRKNEKRFKEREKAAYIAYRYSATLVSHYTELEGQELNEFIIRYTPSYEWLRKHPNDEEIFFYINDHLKLFRKHFKPKLSLELL